MKLLSEDKIDKKKVKIQVYVTPRDHKFLSADSARLGLSVSELVRSHIHQIYANKEKLAS